MPNKLSQFWQELKRRNVVRVVTVYAGAAFVIIELINNITGPLRLPEWTPTFVIVLLATGFPVVIIFSWLYDIHPENGMVRTVSAERVNAEDIAGSSGRWKIASYISFVVIVGLIVLNIIPRARGSLAREIRDKSIAVLPFINDSPDQENEYLINGIMDELLIDLQMIKDLRVPGRTSTEQYRNNLKPIPEIAAEMKVGYIVEASGQRYGDKVRLRVQLVEGVTDRHIWADSYEESINGTEDIFRIQSEIAQLIAAELKAVITPEEKRRIEKVSTSSLTALDFYLKGNDEYWNYRSGRSDEKSLKQAENLFNEALKFDPAFAKAYTGLARIYWGSEGYYSENYLDTVRALLDRALSCDPGLSEAHTLYGSYFNVRNDTIHALREVDKAIALNPNDWEAYSIRADIGSGFINKISSNYKAVLLNRGTRLPWLLSDLGFSYLNIGFWEKAAEAFEEVLKLTGDSAGYYGNQGNIPLYQGNFTDAEKLFQKSYLLDTNNHYAAYGLMAINMVLGNKEQAIRYGDKSLEWMKASSGAGTEFMHRIGYYYLMKGMNKEAEYNFNQEIKYALREIELGRPRTAGSNMNTYYDLAATYAITGEKEKAIESLKMYVKRTVMDANMLNYLRNDFFLDPIRDDPEFQQILNDLETKYQAEHERVRRWLEENDML